VKSGFTDLLVAGDRVRWRLTGPGRGVIEEILPRDTLLSRPRPGSPGSEDLIVANPDQAVFVFSIRQPEPSLRLLDRFLVAAEVNELPSIICANKVDLLDADEDPARVFGLYEDIGYPVDLYERRQRPGGGQPARPAAREAERVDRAVGGGQDQAC